MGTTVGVVIGLFGLAILIAPFALQLYVRSKITVNSDKQALEISSVLVAVAAIFFLGGIVLAAYFSGKSIARVGGKGGKFLEENPQLLLLAA